MLSTSDNLLSERPALPEDDDFLFRVYKASRADEIAAWGWPAEQASHFLRMQFNARAQSYGFAYPDATHFILLAGEAPVGTAIVWRNESELRLVDIAFLPEFRGHGLGARWISGLIREARSSNLPLRLNVFRGNRAAALYERLGFAIQSMDGLYLEMEHNGRTA
jgi:GNAT superfamily N-acetyltransferase